MQEIYIDNIKEVLSPLDYIFEVNVLVNGSSADLAIRSFNDTPDLVNELVRNNVKIHEVSEVVPSLEEVYIGLVEE